MGGSQVGYLQAWLGIWTRTTVKQIQMVREEDLIRGPPDYKTSALTSWPRRLPKCNLYTQTFVL